MFQRELGHGKVLAVRCEDIPVETMKVVAWGKNEGYIIDMQIDSPLILPDLPTVTTSLPTDILREELRKTVERQVGAFLLPLAIKRSRDMSVKVTTRISSAVWTIFLVGQVSIDDGSPEPLPLGRISSGWSG